MAYKKITIKQAQELYVVENKTIEQIAELIKVPEKTLYNWKSRYEWDKLLKTGGTLGLAMEMQKSFYNKIQQAIDDDKLTDPAVSDALYKTAKTLEKLLPEKMMLANIFAMFEDITTCAKTVICDDKFLHLWASYLPEISDFIRRKYND